MTFLWRFIDKRNTFKNIATVEPILFWKRLDRVPARYAEQNMEILLYANPSLFAKRPYQLAGARALKALLPPPAQKDPSVLPIP